MKGTIEILFSRINVLHVMQIVKLALMTAKISVRHVVQILRLTCSSSRLLIIPRLVHAVVLRDTSTSSLCPSTIAGNAT